MIVISDSSSRRPAKAPRRRHHNSRLRRDRRGVAVHPSPRVPGTGRLPGRRLAIQDQNAGSRRLNSALPVEDELERYRAPTAARGIVRMYPAISTLPSPIRVHWATAPSGEFHTDAVPHVARQHVRRRVSSVRCGSSMPTRHCRIDAHPYVIGPGASTSTSAPCLHVAGVILDREL